MLFHWFSKFFQSNLSDNHCYAFNVIPTVLLLRVKTPELLVPLLIMFELLGSNRGPNLKDTAT